MKEVEMICITCPLGCHMTVQQEADGTVLSVKGNTCKRGEIYARAELTHPVRVLTSTVKVGNRDGSFCAVKTDCAISKGKLFSAMEEVNRLVATAPIHIGDILIENFLGECNLVATSEVE